jgi:hypothetical protein
MRSVFAAAALLLASCGGSSPLDNPPDVNNGGSGGTNGNRLSFSYFQKCVNPIVTTAVDPNKNCANAGCHGPNGAGAAYRALIAAADVPLPVGAGQAETVRQTEDMYKNFRSAAGQATLTNVALSSLLTKPLNTVIHRGGQIFPNASVTEAQIIRFWISNPVPATDDEFSASIDHILFSNGDPVTGTCNQ